METLAIKTNKKSLRQQNGSTERRITEILRRKMTLRQTGPYAAKTAAQVTDMLTNAFTAEGYADLVITDVERMAGGASKEQFSFHLSHRTAPQPERLVLRMDPLEGIVQTCRGREAQVITAVAGVVPVPQIRFVDADGLILGQPGLIMNFLSGVTKPPDVASNDVSGIGSRFDDWAEKLKPQFVQNLVNIHNLDWRRLDLSYFDAPPAGTHHAALSQVNWWSLVWQQDMVEAVPVITLAERWLRENAPICEQPVMVHGDYRIGNFMFDAVTGKFTAVLDWEFAHLGDFHEDLGYAVQRLYGSPDTTGAFLICGLFTREEFFARYENVSGRKIDLAKLRYYEILNAYKCAIMSMGTAMRVAQLGNSHQDLVLSWLGPAGPIFLDQIVKLIQGA
jgi:aminoglycoside phosphotransferase (APT) family kinase protein